MAAIANHKNLPLEASMLEASAEWGCPPWEIDEQYPDWFWRWAYYTNIKRSMENKQNG